MFGNAVTSMPGEWHGTLVSFLYSLSVGNRQMPVVFVELAVARLKFLTVPRTVSKSESRTFPAHFPFSKDCPRGHRYQYSWVTLSLTNPLPRSIKSELAMLEKYSLQEISIFSSLAHPLKISPTKSPNEAARMFLRTYAIITLPSSGNIPK